MRTHERLFMKSIYQITPVVKSSKNSFDTFLSQRLPPGFYFRMLQTRSISTRACRSSRNRMREFIKRHVRKQAILYSPNEHDGVRIRIITGVRRCAWIDKGAKARTRVSPRRWTTACARSLFQFFDQSKPLSLPSIPSWNARAQFYFP